MRFPHATRKTHNDIPFAQLCVLLAAYGTIRKCSDTDRKHSAAKSLRHFALSPRKIAGRAAAASSACETSFPRRGQLMTTGVSSMGTRSRLPSSGGGGFDLREQREHMFCVFIHKHMGEIFAEKSAEHQKHRITLVETFSLKHALLIWSQTHAISSRIPYAPTRTRFNVAFAWCCLEGGCTKIDNIPQAEWAHCWPLCWPVTGKFCQGKAALGDGGRVCIRFVYKYNVLRLQLFTVVSQTQNNRPTL